MMEKQKCRRKSDGKMYRVMREEDGQMFVFAKNSRLYGWRMSEASFEAQYELIRPRLSETEAWHKRIRRAVRLMEESGLWPDVKEELELLLNITSEEHKALRAVRWKGASPEETAIAEAVKAKHPELFVPDEPLTPWAFCTSEIGDCRMESMWFGRENKDIKENIRNCLRSKTAFNYYRLPASYDVSAEYSPEKAKAWYSKEYRGCGNGHYYMMLNHSTALFVESD